jgi:hypothetical protein
MIEFAIPIDMATASLAEQNGRIIPPIDVRTLDDLYYRYVTADGTAPTTGVLKLMTARAVGEPPYEAATLTLDGTPQTVAIDGVAQIQFATTTAESGRTGTLYIFARRAQE